MNKERTSYISPFSRRYASTEMQYLFSEEKKFKTWRKLWIALAESEKELGLPISDQQITELKQFAEKINYETAEEKEREIRHDVMSHLFAYAQQAPEGGKILHLGATSCFVGDNTDLIIIKDALNLIKQRLLHLINNLKKFALETKDIATLGFTHFQPAQLTTVGKRTTLWLYDFLSDFEEITIRLSQLRARGVKGTTGTQASFVNLFKGDANKIKQLDAMVSEKIGFKKSYPVTGQTYPRKTDSFVISSLSGIAQSAHKLASDIRLLANLKELEEPFEKKQVGSSAMAYKRNPMRSERICALSRFVIAQNENPAYTAATQWLERTLDDSANRRLSLAETFLATDAVLLLLINVTDGIIVNKAIIDKNIDRELPFMITENLLMEGAKKGESRQELHEVIRDYSHKAAAEVKAGGENNLLTMLAKEEKFPLNLDEIHEVRKNGNFTGRAAEQVVDFIQDEVDPILTAHNDILKEKDKGKHTIL